MIAGGEDWRDLPQKLSLRNQIFTSCINNRRLFLPSRMWLKIIQRRRRNTKHPKTFFFQEKLAFVSSVITTVKSVFTTVQSSMEHQDLVSRKQLWEVIQLIRWDQSATLAIQRVTFLILVAETLVTIMIMFEENYLIKLFVIMFSRVTNDIIINCNRIIWLQLPRHAVLCRLQD